MKTAGNQLIEMLPRKEQRRLEHIAERVQLVQSQVLGDVGEAIRHVYFPIDGFISLVTSIDGKPVLEVGMVGHEGMFGAQVALGVTIQPLHAVIQGPGLAWRMKIGAFRDEWNQSGRLQQVMSRYVYVLMTQLATSASCTRFHEINPRLGRWLLMTQDRARGDSFQVTQEFLGLMLGVRRVGITAAAGDLQRRGLIEYSRGKVTVLNRQGLEAAACSCYAADRATYRRVLN